MAGGPSRRSPGRSRNDSVTSFPRRRTRWCALWTSPNSTVRNWSPVDYLAAAAVVLGGGLLRFLGLAQPAAFVFDEHFYAPDACWYALASPTVCEVAKESIRLHPPLAKSLIGAGIALV